MIYAIDFDGTLCKSMYPKIGSPIQEMIDYCIQLKNDNQIILWTCRTGKELDEAIEWCEEKGIKFDAINENLPEIIEKFKGDCRKIYADIYIDDKSVHTSEIKRHRVLVKISKGLEGG